MAGKPGMKGGGGARPGAGRPSSRPETLVLSATEDPKVFLLAVMNGNLLSMRLRIEAAKALMPFVHRRQVTPGKKAEAQAAARTSLIGTPWEGLLP